MQLATIKQRRDKKMIYVKEEFTENDKTYRKVIPCGMLYTHSREYFLLSPYPIEADWEALYERRFVVVPRKQVWQLEDGTKIYPFARHIVTDSFTIDYAANMPTIIIAKLNDRIDLAETELPVRDVNDYIRELEEVTDELELDGFPY